MSDLALFFGTIFGIMICGLIIYKIDQWKNCNHAYGMWEVEESDDAYVQARCCGKCGYMQIEQLPKYRSNK